MEIPITGVLAFFIALGLFLFHQKYFLYAAVFFMPFSAVAVINFPLVEKSITYPLFFSILYLANFYIRNDWSDFLFKKRMMLGELFFLWCCFSSIVGYYSDVFDIGYYNGISFSQLLYLWVGVSLTLTLPQQNDGASQPDLEIIKTIYYSVLVVCLIGLYQLFAYNFELPYPAFIFNNSVNPYDQGYAAFIGNGVKRISSVSTEPSIFASFLLVSFAMFYFFYISSSKRLISWDARPGVILALVCLVLSTSMTAYLGLLLVFLSSFFLIKNNVYKAIIFLSSSFFGYFLFPYLENLVLSKLSSHSFVERSDSILKGLEYFLNAPVFGAGWGAVTVHSLPVGLLANVGLVGFVLFLIWVFTELKVSSEGMSKKKESGMGLGVTAAFLILFIIQVISGFSYVYSYFWIFFGLLINENLLISSMEKH